MAAKLVAEEGLLKGLVLPLEGSLEWVIGRDPEACQLLVEDPAASRRHVVVRSTPEGLLVENLSSSNPTEVNDEEVVEPRLLKDGDTVKIGSGMFRFFTDLNGVQDGDTSPQEAMQSEEIDPAISQQEELVPAANTNPEEHHDTIFDLEGDNTKEMSLAEINFDLVETGRWLLKVVAGPNNGAEFSMHEGKGYVIGTDPSTCDILFHDTSVSRQHARVSITEDGQVMIEDLKSRNGILVDGQTIEGRTTLPLNVIVSLGTSCFVVYDREGNMQTIISPLLPSIVKMLQKEEEKNAEEAAAGITRNSSTRPLEVPKPKTQSMSSFVLMAALTGLFIIVGLGIALLFRAEPVEREQNLNVDDFITNILKNTPDVRYSYNQATGRLLLVGHVLSPSDKQEVLNELQGQSSLRVIDDSGLIIDEYVWQNFNLLLSRNPSWRTITVSSPQAGQFLLSGYLKTKAETDKLNEYITQNFPYLDRLKNQVVSEEDMMAFLNNKLQQKGLYQIKVTFGNGDVALEGGIPDGEDAALAQVIEEIKAIPGVRTVRSLVGQITPEESMQNISSRYEVSGTSKIGDKVNVMINGRIVTTGDVLDGMEITNITPNAVFLQREGVKYRIDLRR